MYCCSPNKFDKKTSLFTGGKTETDADLYRDFDSPKSLNSIHPHHSVFENGINSCCFYPFQFILFLIE